MQLFKRRLASGQTSVLVFYRGERSFFCRQWLRRWLTIPALDRRLQLSDVVIFFTSSQSQGKAFSVADQIAAQHSLLDRRLFFIGDPEHLLANALPQFGINKPIITNPDSHRAHGWVFDYGMVQPAIIAVSTDSTVIYDWTSKPSILNVAGKLDRPDPWDVWDCIERRLDRIRISKARASRLSTLPPPDRHCPVDPSQQSPSPVFPLSPASLQRQSSCTPSTAVPVSGFQPFSPDSYVDTFTKAHSSDQSQPCTATSYQDSAHALPDSAHISQEGEALTVPRSTSIDTFVCPGTNITLLQEDLDVSQTSAMAHVSLQQAPERISALAVNLLSCQDGKPFSPPGGSHVPSGPINNSGPDRVKANQPTFCRAPRNEITYHLATPDLKNMRAPSLGNDEYSTDDDHIDLDSEIDMLENHSHFAVVSEEPIENCYNDLTNGTFSTTTTVRTKTEGELEPTQGYIDKRKTVQLIQPHLFEHQPSLTEPMDTSVTSAGSDQVDSAIMTKNAGMRANGSGRPLSAQYDCVLFSSDRRIPEEADDKKLGVSDHLCDLKEPFPLQFWKEKERQETRVLGAAPSSKDTDNFIPEPQISLKNAESLGASPVASSPNLSNSQCHNSPIPQASSFTHGILNVASFSDVENTLPLSSKMIDNSSSIKGTTSHIKRFATMPSLINTERHANILGESAAMSTLRDEYEAYDEYIVCEYQVEEQVEEYESDSLSKSRDFMRTPMPDGPPVRSSSLRNMDSKYMENDQAVPIQDLGREPDRDGSTAAPMTSVPTLSPKIETRVLEWQRSAEDSTVGHNMQKVLRRIKVPIMAVRRKVGGKGQEHDRHGDHAVENVQEECDSSVFGATTDCYARLRRKENQRRSMLCKRTERMKMSGHISPSVSGRLTESSAVRDTDGNCHGSARLGRKETFRAVFCKIPMPKHRRRSSTGGAISTLSVPAENPCQRNEGENEYVHFVRNPNLGNNGSRPSAVQTVTQRLPTLSLPQEHTKSTAPETHEETVQNTAFMKLTRVSNDVDHAQNQGQERAEVPAEGLSPSRQRYSFEGCSGSSIPNARPESPELMEDTLLPFKLFDGDVTVAGLFDEVHNAERTVTSPRKDPDERTKNVVRRLEFCASASRASLEDGSDGGEQKRKSVSQCRTSAGLSKPIHGPVNYDSDDTDEWRRRQREKQAKMNAIGRGSMGGSVLSDAEKLGHKASFGSVGDRFRTRRKRNRV